MTNGLGPRTNGEVRAIVRRPPVQPAPCTASGREGPVSSLPRATAVRALMRTGRTARSLGHMKTASQAVKCFDIPRQGERHASAKRTLDVRAGGDAQRSPLAGDGSTPRTRSSVTAESGNAEGCAGIDLAGAFPMQVDLRMLRCFVAVAEELHFGRAACRLMVAQPAVSRTVRALEQRLGLDLLRRTSRHVELTEAGEALLEPSREMLARHEALLVEAFVLKRTSGLSEVRSAESAS